jgi:hypothetical protein
MVAFENETSEIRIWSAYHHEFWFHSLPLPRTSSGGLVLALLLRVQEVACSILDLELVILLEK